MATSPTNIPADLPKDLTHELTVELSGNQDYAKAAGVMGLGFGYATAGGVYGMPAGAISNFGSAYSSAFGNLGSGGYLLPTAALYGTGTLEGTNRYSGPLLAGCAPYGLLPGYAQPWAGTYATYRIMSAHPTLVLAGAAVMGPILASSWSFEQNRKKAPKEAKGFIADLLMPLRPRLLLECLKALVFGWRGFEKIYSLKGGYLTLDRLKPLLPELTSILINDKGHLAGLSQADVEASSDGIQIPAEKAFVYTYEGDGDNHYGRSRHENCRRQWSNWLMDEDNLGRLGSKVSSIIPQIGYPPGDGIDSQGNLQSNYQLAVQLATGLASGRPITMPNLASLTIDDLTRLPELAQASLWSIKTIDMGNPGPAQEALLKQLQYRDALLVRGWLRPERSLLESQRSGSRADSQVHADLGLTDCELVHADIAEAINRQIIDPLLAFNFGEETRGCVYIKAAAVSDDQQILDQRMLQAIAANPQLLPQLIAHLDMDAWLDRSGLPRNQLAGAWDGKMQAEREKATDAPSAAKNISHKTIELFNSHHGEDGRFTTAALDVESNGAFEERGAQEPNREEDGVTAAPATQPSVPPSTHPTRTTREIQQIVGAKVDGIAGAKTTEKIKQFQQRLINDGYYHGTVDGKWGPETDTAYERYLAAGNAQTPATQPVSTRPTTGNTKAQPRTTEEIQHIVGANVDGKRGPDTIAKIKQFQQKLLDAGYFKGMPNGQWSRETETAYQKFIAEEKGARTKKAATVPTSQPASQTTTKRIPPPTTQASSLKLSSAGVLFIKAQEQLRLAPYDDHTGSVTKTWVEGATIGYGHFIIRGDWDIYAGGISHEQAEELFQKDLQPFNEAVRNVIKVNISQNQFDALVSLAYNIGIKAFKNSSVVKLMNDPSAVTPYRNLEDAWKAWNKAGQDTKSGLIDRRDAEWELFNK